MATVLLFNSTFETGTLAQQGWDEVNSGSADSSIVLASSEGITAHGGVDICKMQHTAGGGEAGTRLQIYTLDYDHDYAFEWYEYYPDIMSNQGVGGDWGPQLFGLASTDINNVNMPIWILQTIISGGVMKPQMWFNPSNHPSVGAGPLSTDNSTPKSYSNTGITIPTDQWVKWRIEARPAGNFTGHLRVYMNDTEVFNFSNIKTTVPDSGQRALYGDWVMMYPQWTMYGDGLTPQPCVKYMDDVSVFEIDRALLVGQAVETDTAQVILAEQPPVFSPVLRAYRWYFDNGTPATATPAAAENTPYTIAPGQALHLRVSIEETAGVSAGGVQAFGLQQSRNGSSLSSVGATSIWVEVWPSANITDNEATAQRLSSGNGSFSAGGADDVNGAFSKQLLANTFTEIVYSIWMDDVNSVLVPGDVMTFDVALGGVAFPENVVPQLTVVSSNDTIVAVGQANESEAVQPLTVNKSRVLAQVTEAETAGALGKLKLKGLATALESESAQAFASQKLKALLLASDAEQALEIQPNAAHAMGLVLESESAQQITAIKTKLLNQAHDAEVAREMLLGGAPAPEAPFFIDLTTGQIYWRVGKFIIPL